MIIQISVIISFNNPCTSNANSFRCQFEPILVAEELKWDSDVRRSIELG